MEGLKLYTKKEAATFLGVSVKSLLRIVNRGEIHFRVIGVKKIMFCQVDLDTYVCSREVVANEDIKQAVVVNKDEFDKLVAIPVIEKPLIKDRSFSEQREALGLKNVEIRYSKD